MLYRKAPIAEVPKFLQVNTKQNLVFQLGITVVVLGGYWLWTKHQDKKIQEIYNDLLN